MKVLNTTETSYHLEKLVKEASEKLTIVSPYLQINKLLRVSLEDAFNRCSEVNFVFRTNQLKFNEKKWLEEFKHVNLIDVQNLHAKCYLNENIAILSSMNLYEYSQINNHEMSVYIERNQEKDAYKDIIDKVNDIIRASDFLKRKAIKEKAQADKEARKAERKKKLEERIAKDAERRRLLEQNKTQNNSTDKAWDGTYTMGTLISKLKDEFDFTAPIAGGDKVYRYLCWKAMKLVNFSQNELYQDKDAVLRSTQLGEERYMYLQTELKKFGTPKKE